VRVVDAVTGEVRVAKLFVAVLGASNLTYAEAEPTFRFYQLYDKLYRWDVLVEALRRAKANRGAAGVDGQTFEQVTEYGEERWLRDLQRELQEKRYRPQPVRRVLIAKPGGGERPLGIPTIKERVTQTAAKLILEPIFEADLDDAAYGYRPERSGVQAVQRVHQELSRGRTEVVDADVSKYFDTIPHAELMKCVARRIADKAVLHLVKMWLKVPVEERDELGRPRYSRGKRSKQGTPQGGVISPLLANIYINRLLKAFARSDLMKRSGAVLVNYADDFVVLSSRGAAQALAQVRGWLEGMKLKLNEEKTSIRMWRGRAGAEGPRRAADGSRPSRDGCHTTRRDGLESPGCRTMPTSLSWALAVYMLLGGRRWGCVYPTRPHPACTGKSRTSQSMTAETRAL
jgi:RNA-directed DNA polymerase